MMDITAEIKRLREELAEEGRRLEAEADEIRQLESGRFAVGFAVISGFLGAALLAGILCL